MVGLALLLAVMAPAAPQPDPTEVPRPVLSPRWRPPAPTTAEPGLEEQARALGLRRKGTGYARVRNPDDRFDALVRADGRVVFTLDPEVTAKVDGICALAICIGGKTEELTRKRKAARGAGLVALMLAEAALTGTAQVGNWGYGTPRQGPLPGIERQDRLPDPLPLAHVVGRYGSLPAPVAAMSDFMDDTFDFRMELATVDAERSLSRAHDDLVRTVEAIWDSPRPAAEKRAAVLKRWTELDAPAPERDVPLSASLDAMRGAAATKARTFVLTSVREHAPAGSPEAFTPGELEAFNRNVDGQPFCPYMGIECPGVVLDVPPSAP